MIKGAVLVSPKFFISFILIIIIICIILVIVQPGTNVKKDDSGLELPQDYFKRPKDWGTTTGQTVTVKNSQGGICPITGTSICSLYTYENDFDIDIKPSLINVFQDYYNGLVHQNTNISNLRCIDTNQILAQNGKHTCESKIPNSCINAYGNYVNYGVSENYVVNCRNGLPTCPGAIYSISSNFQLNFVNSLDINSKFLAINNIEVNDKDYEKLSQEKNYYIEQGYFTKNNSLAEGTYRPIFFNDMYKSSSARQQFKFLRYIYNSSKKSWEFNELGPFAAIIFQPANAYLTADENFDFILKTLDNINYYSDPSTIIQWLMLPSMNLQPGVIPSITKFSRGNIKNLSSQATVYGTSNQNENSVYFDPSKVFPAYSDVKINDVVAPLELNLPSVIFTYDGDGDANVINAFPKNNYPEYIFKAVVGGPASYQADFYDIGLSAKHSYTTWEIDGSVAKNITKKSDFISLDQVTGIPLNPSGELITGYSTLDNGETVADHQSIDADQIDIITTVSNNAIGNFNYGDLIFDNQVAWESINPYQTVTAFDPNYFIQSRGISLAHTISLNNSGTIKYDIEKKGLVDRIETGKLNYSFTEFTPGSKQVLLNSDNTNLDISPNPNTNAVIDLIFESSQDTNGNPVVALAEILVLNPGDSYSNGTFDIYATALGASSSTQPVANLSLVTKEQEVFYTAISLDKDGQPFNISNEKTDNFSNGGLIIPNTDVTINSQGVFSLTTNDISLGPSFGGEGYAINDIIYINQIDQFGNSLLGPDFDSNNITKDNMIKLASVKINSLQPAPNTIDYPSQYSLLRSIPINNNFWPDRGTIQYNFYDNSPGKYQASPPQIAFVGQGLIDQLKEIIKEGSAEELSSFFGSAKKGENTSFFTSIENIRTIQFTELNYIGTAEDNFKSDFVNNNNLTTDAQPVLGRFIPYIWFQPPKAKLLYEKKYFDPRSKKYFVVKKFERIPSQLNANIYYNNNYTQLVPYGLKNIYNRYIDPQNLASV